MHTAKETTMRHLIATLIYTTAVLGGLFLALGAFASDGGVDLSVAAAPVAPALDAVVGPDGAATIGAAKDLLTLIQTRKGTQGFWWLVVAVALRIVVGLVRWLGRKIPGKVGAAVAKVVDHPVVAYVLPFVLSIVGGMATAAAGGQPVFSLDLVNTAITVGTGAIGIYVGEKKIKEAMGKGVAAAASPGPTLNG